VKADVASRERIVSDTGVDRLAPLDVELARLRQNHGHNINATVNFARKDLDARSTSAVKSGFAQRHG
jgi:hypothetical protein